MFSNLRLNTGQTTVAADEGKERKKKRREREREREREGKNNI